jgi:hypothetical protein
MDMRVASGPFGRPHRLLLWLLLLPSLSACHYLFGDFSEEQVIQIDPTPSGGRDGVGGRSGACAEGTPSCEDGQLFACVEGFQSFQQDCGAPELCDASGDGRCLVCIEDDFECLDTKNSRHCEDGEWVEHPACEGALRCSEEVEQCVACDPGDGVCVGAVLCTCLEDLSGWEARTCLRGCKREGFNDRCIEDLAMLDADASLCSKI